jgi:hypothetical protein
MNGGLMTTQSATYKEEQNVRKISLHLGRAEEAA